MKPFLLPALLSLSALPLAADPLKIPRAEGIVIDGQSADWAATKSYQAGRLLDLAGKPPEPADSLAKLQLAWDDQGLLIGITVLDDTFTEVESELYMADSLEIFVATEPGSKNRYQFLFGPGLNPKFPQVRTHLSDQRPDKAIPLAVDSARAAIPGGYFMEARLKWSNLEITPAEGATLAAQVMLNDVDGQDPRYRAVWYPGELTSTDSTLMFPLALAAEAGPPPAGLVRVQRLGAEFALRVFCEPSDRDRYAEFLDGDKLVARHLIPPGASEAGVLYKPGADAGAELFAKLGGEPIGSLAIFPTKPLTKRDFNRVPYALVPNVFEGEEFPPLRLKEIEKIEARLGPVKTSQRFFDADYNEVTKPGKPGRYGVVLTVTTRSGESTQRHFTLFRQPAKTNWVTEKLDFTGITLPPSLGIDPQVASEHRAHLAKEFSRSWEENLGQEDWHAVQLAGLFEAGKLGHEATYMEDPWRRDTIWWYGLRKKLGVLQPLDRMVALPKDYEADPAKKWPLVLFLHGSGDGDTPEHLKKWGPPKEIAKGREFPFIMVAPRSEPGQYMWWNPTQLGELIDELEATFRIDKDRIYLTGLSMGGFGCFYLATEFPDRFAAMVPFCGGGDVSAAARIAHLPTWAFHGEEDKAVPVERTREMMAAMEAAGGHPKATYFPKVGHTCWDEAYSGTEIYDWLLSQKRRPKEK